MFTGKNIFTGKTVGVGRYPANAWGLHDMHGNVWEWTCSVYDENYGGGEQRCADSGTNGPRVLRGGSWGLAPGGVRGAARFRLLPRVWLDTWGFRLARTFP
ncbi:MAG: SUMF1/EgtB/PvdO family nonheme iron enzyme [Candidatus Competibacteraceae bacterium]